MRPPERGLLELPQWVLSHPPPPHEVELDLGPEEEGPRKGQASSQVKERRVNERIKDRRVSG